jgi:hypothetical protein
MGISTTDDVTKLCGQKFKYNTQDQLCVKIMKADLATIPFNCLVISVNKKWGNYFLDHKPDTPVYYPSTVHPAALPDCPTAPAYMKHFWVEYQPPQEVADIKQAGIWRRTLMTRNKPFERFMELFCGLFTNIKTSGHGTVKIWFNTTDDEWHNEEMRWILFQMAVMVFPKLVFHDQRIENDYTWKHEYADEKGMVRGWSMFNSPYL